MKYNLPITFLLILFSITSNADILFSDSFESQDMSAPDNQPDSTNLMNFNWESNNSTSIVSMDPESVAVYNNKSIYNIQPGNDWNAKDGKYSLRFRYAAGRNMAEQRFNFTPQQDLWIRYWIRVPVNFYHGNLNNKFFAIYGSTYDGDADVTWQTRPLANGNAELRVQDGGVQSGELLPVPFINRETDLGRWMQIVIHVKNATSSSSNDGVIQLWRRWEDESNFTNLHDKQDAIRQWEPGTLGYRAGYFKGWANDPYNVDTEWLVDKVEFANDSLLTPTDTPVEKPKANPPSTFNSRTIAIPTN